MGVTIASSSLPLQQVRPPGAATSFNKALILYTVSQYPSSCNAKKEKKQERTVVIWIICHFAGAGVCKNRPEATKQASDSACEGAGGGRAKTNLF